MVRKHIKVDRITNVEVQNKEQAEEIHFLKIEASENRNAINLMEVNMKELALKIGVANINSNANVDQVIPLSNIENKHPEKRPARLLPLQLFNNK